MLDDVRYIELKSGYADDGPAWIGRVKLSRSGRTLYFNGLALQKWYADRLADVETGQRYWVSRLKKNGWLVTYDEPFQGRNRRYYRLTDSGRDRLQEIRSDWRDFSQAVAQLLEGNTHE